MSRLGVALMGQRQAHAPAHIEARQVADGQRAHGHTPFGDDAVHLFGRGPLLYQEGRLADQRQARAVGDEAMANLGEYADLAGGLGQRHSGGDRIRCTGRTTHHLQQFHGVGRDKIMQPDHVGGARGGRRDGVDIHIRRVGGEQRARFGHAVELGEDLLLHVEVLKRRLDDEVRITKRRVIDRAGNSAHPLGLSCLV